MKNNQILLGLILTTLSYYGPLTAFGNLKDHYPSMKAFIQAAVVFPLEPGFLIAAASASLAVFLFIVSFLSYRREKRRRLFFLMIAFLVFAAKDTISAVGEAAEFLSTGIATSIFTFEHVALMLDFLILLTLFLGLTRK